MIPLVLMCVNGAVYAQASWSGFGDSDGVHQL